MRLYIAEKPSMGLEIAKCLPGPMNRKDGCIVTGGGVVTWGFGHILRQAEPGEYDVKYQRWRMEHLPIIPEEWKLFVDASCQKQFEIIKNLIAEASEIVHAGDPDREGQLLIDEVLDYIHNEKPVLRILLNALDEKSIKKAIASLRDNKDFYNLKQSALGRARADWLIGMNLSRAYTLAAQMAGHKLTLPVGRVKTPTLALVVRREREIKNFTQADYFTVKAEFKHENGSFTGYWKPRDNQQGLDTEGRLADNSIANALLEKLNTDKEPAKITSCETTEKKESQRLPFSLSALQVMAGKKFGYDPQTVLDTAQKLYEKKLTSYPRSDCDYLPENQHSDGTVIMENLKNCGHAELAKWAHSANTGLKSRAWDDKKITAHHAIIPTIVKCDLAALTEAEQNIYFIIAQGYIAQFHELYIYNQTRAEIEHSQEQFVANGRIITQMGWKELYSNNDIEEKAEDDEGNLPFMQKGDQAAVIQAIADKKITRPPKRFTASTLLAAMKEIHKYVKNPDMKSKLKSVSGIGTEATRATIIKELVQRGFLKEQKKPKYLVPTDMAYLLIDALPEELTYPDYTALWENILHNMANGSEKLADFLSEQASFAASLCAKAHDLNLPLNGEHTCPQCNQGILQARNGKNGPFWGCSRYPLCRASYDDINGQPKKPEHICPRCKQGELKLKNGKNGAFWGCTKFPQCRATYNDQQGKPQIPIMQINKKSPQ